MFSRYQAWVSALLAGVLSFASPKESSQRKGDPKVGAPSGFLALLGEPGGLPELACGSDKASRRPPVRLRCSAPLKGTQRASTLNQCAPKNTFPRSTGKRPKIEGKASRTPTHTQSPSFPRRQESTRRLDSRLQNYGAIVSARVVSPGPLRGAEQRRFGGGRRLALSEPQASFANRPPNRVAQGTGVAGTDPGVAFSLATFFWRSKRKYARQQGGNPS